MTTKNISVPITNFPEIKQKVLNLSKEFNTFCFLDNHGYNIHPHTQECILAAGVKRKLSCQAGKSLDALQEFIDKEPSWLFGHISYDVKNELEQLHSSHPDKLRFPDLFFFEPEVLIRLTEEKIVIEAEDPSAIHHRIINAGLFSDPIKSNADDDKISCRLTRDEYISTVERLRQHILRGDCYEINYCVEFYADDVAIDPYAVYRELSRLSPNPFSAFYRLEDKWVLCASPERFLKKDAKKILSQPIKGTSVRLPGDSKGDSETRENLFLSAKDRSENVMVVDLVRNDLAKVCEEGTVKVDELYGIYSFPQVHQMISTVSGTLRSDCTFKDIITATFPMGSMTGAPKKRVMELIERYEGTRRGIFSGALGYISPGGDFDFNVVIRSIFYNQSTKYLSFQAGSGITFYSVPQFEWDECALKAMAMKKALHGLMSE